MENLESLRYSKQYILFEDEQTKIYKKINDQNSTETVDKYLWDPVTTITESIVDDEKFYLIQHDDQKLGWINLKKSIQVFRFEPETYRFLDQNFKAHEINLKIGIDKDFRTHFNNKLLTVKSEINIDGTRLFSVFVKNKFFGFHPIEYFEKMIECDIPVDSNILKDKAMYKVSSLKSPTTEEVKIENPRLVTVFKNSKIGRVKVNNKQFFWIELYGMDDLINGLDEEKEKERSINQKILDDIFYGIKIERNQSKEIVKTILSAKKYMKAKKKNNLSSYISDDNNDEQITALKKEIKLVKESNNKLEKQIKLGETRLNQQRDYNSRLEQQRDKYKQRMQLVEEKLKKIVEKNNKK
ncbi:hypothetical protein [Corticicoccus populi]|uniref:Uncharacterized protein n=1 Tax=Corticicoccus populi TaxID=1812821 RepID=A0ABW5WT97_9STAP